MHLLTVDCDTFSDDGKVKEFDLKTEKVNNRVNGWQYLRWMSI